MSDRSCALLILPSRTSLAHLTITSDVSTVAPSFSRVTIGPSLPSRKPVVSTSNLDNFRWYVTMWMKALTTFVFPCETLFHVCLVLPVTSLI